jgi:hypothetical protein
MEEENELGICDISDPEELYTPRFVTPQELEEARKLFQIVDPDEVKRSLYLYQVELSPGSVRISKKLREPRNTREAIDLHKVKMNYQSREAITNWSKKSRSAMVARICSLDYSEMLSDPTRPGAMITLTYPKNWEIVAPTAEQAKRHLRLFRQRYKRAFGEELIGLWKQEWQRRGACHFHIFCVPPTNVAFTKWVSDTWNDIVNPPYLEDKCNHLEFGASVDYNKGLRSKDAKQVSIYFTKHGSANFGDKEYQNRPPDLWLEQGSIGRMWGYWGLALSIIKTEISQSDALFVARTLRRWARANAKRRKTTVAKINKKTGPITYRKVMRYPRYFSGALGFVSVNDGSVMGATLSRAIRTCRR